MTIDTIRNLLPEFCRRWHIQEVSLFGSALSGSMRADSDIDLLVLFDPKADWSLLDQAAMAEELEAALGRRVDLVNRRAVERSTNSIRRRAILESARVIYAA